MGVADWRQWAPAAAIIVGAVLGRIVLSGHLGLSEDEAYYWVWGQRLDAGYFDHPPAIAWIIRAGTELLGDTERGVRLVGIGLGGLAAGLAAAAARDRLLVAFAVISMPLLALGGILATPDVPLLAAWCLGILAATRERWGLLGLACGLAMLSKYTGVLLLPLVVAARPSALRTRGPWLAGAIALLVYLPNVWWNLSHDLISWSFQLDHVAQEARRLDFLAAQVGLAGPVVFFVMAAWWAVGWRGDAVERLCWWTSLPVLLLGVWAGGEANWAAPAFIGPLIAISRRSARWRRAAWIGSGISLALSSLVLVHAVRPLLELPNDPLHRLVGGEILADSVAAWGIDAVYAERYQEAALIHFYSGIPAHALPGVARPDQYDLWPVTLADHALFVRVRRGSHDIPILDELGYRFEQVGTISAHAPTTDPMVDRPVARWNVVEIWLTD